MIQINCYQFIIILLKQFDILGEHIIKLLYKIRASRNENKYI